jgi:hypothetical protein
MAARLLERAPAFAALRIAVARRLRAATPRPRAAIHAAFAARIAEAWRAVDGPPDPPRFTSDGAGP